MCQRTCHLINPSYTVSTTHTHVRKQTATYVQTYYFTFRLRQHITAIEKVAVIFVTTMPSVSSLALSMSIFFSVRCRVLTAIIIIIAAIATAFICGLVVVGAAAVVSAHVYLQFRYTH